MLTFHNSMPTRNLYLPNGQRLTVQPVFGGFFFRPIDVNLQSNAFPAGWTVILQTELDTNDDENSEASSDNLHVPRQKKTHQILPYRHPTLQHDNLFISSISNPSSNDHPSQTSPNRQIAMMLWASLYWYFHQEEPSRLLSNKASKKTPNAGKPHGEWKINIKREGVLRGRSLMQSLERMGLVTSEDSSVGVSTSGSTAKCWSNTFTSRRSFWQIPDKLFLFTLTSSGPNSLFPGSPHSSRPNSPVRGEHKNPRDSGEVSIRHSNVAFLSQHVVGPMTSGSHAPIYYPPMPLQYVISQGTRHPLRPKPPCQGEVFYSRYIPSVSQYLSFRTASLSEKPILANGPTSPPSNSCHHSNYSLPSFSTTFNVHTSNINHQHHDSVLVVPTQISASSSDAGSPSTPTDQSYPLKMTDLQLLHKWMNIPRVSKFWGSEGPMPVQEDFLRRNLLDQHSFPVIGLWDGKPFGYFEIYWAKEDPLNAYLGNESLGNWDRGLHVLVGEEEYRGEHRLKCWLTALAHWIFTEDSRTDSIVLEPRVDNERFISHLQDCGFFKEREVSFPHKQSALVRLRRDNFEAPVI
ncbi:Acyltransferase [Podosphaera aphanis]|nr:Acyltransferase [Podosphaera aphanis]